MMMQTAFLLARLLLSAVFGVAGLAKLFDRAGSRQALVNFGVPPKLAGPLALLLPVAELAVAVALLPASAAWLGALGALALLLVFAAGIAFNLARGRQPDCHCFGQLSSAPAGPATLVRNFLLALAAGFVVWGGRADPGPSAVAWFGELDVAARAFVLLGVAFLAALAVQGWLLWQVLRQQGRLLLRLDRLEESVAGGAALPGATPPEPGAGLRVGTPAPGFRLGGLHGETLTLDALLAAGRPVLLLFVHPGCDPCQALLPEVSRWQRTHGSELTLALISEGTVEANLAKCARHGVAQVLLQEGREVAEAYRAHGTPSALLIGTDGRIGSPLAQGADDVRNLLARAVGAAAPRRAELPLAGRNGHHAGGHPAEPLVEPGQPPPPVEFEDLNGQTVSLASLTGGRRTLLLFWNPGCGFCQQMLDDLRAWEDEAPADAPRLLLVSSGAAEENRAMNLRSTVVLDQRFRLGAALGANGTPTAVLLDADGKVASAVAAGATAVFALADESVESPGIGAAG